MGNAKRPDVTKEFPDMKGQGDIQKKLGEMWKELSAEDRQPWTAKEKEEKEAYETALKEYRESPEYKKYKAVVDRASGTFAGKVKAKMAGKKPKAAKLIPLPEEPANLPKQPP